MTRLRQLAARHPSWCAVVAVLTMTAVVLVVGGGAARASARTVIPRTDAMVARGRRLFVTGCSSCHGVEGRGVRAPNGAVRGPSLEHSGAAAAYYYLHTGRMPLGDSEEAPVRKRPSFTGPEMDALVAYVASLGKGPAVPKVNVDGGDLSQGGELFRANCAACHSASGAGGALSYGRAAPALQQAEPLEVGSAVRIGPGQMPRFGRQTISDRELSSVARYVEYLRRPEDPGGLALGRIGPIPEGFLIWVFGIGLLLVVVAWIGKRDRPLTDASPTVTEPVTDR